MKKGRITRDSIRESFNTLPEGLCFYYDSGMPVLVNNLMNELCIKITGRPLRNGKYFSDEVTGKVIEAGGSFYKFSTEIIKIKDRTVNQLTAIDVTELYKYSEELKEENEKLSIMNDRLKDYGKNVEELTRNEEILNAKTRIHDNLGSILLETKISLESGKNSFSHLSEKWRNTMKFLQDTEDSDSVTDYNNELRKTADSLGIRLIINGSINGNGLFTGAVKESVVNAVKHSDAGTVTVYADERKLTVITDASVPVREITEAGGLANLRKKAETGGYDMTVSADDGFKLILEKK